MSLNTYGLLMGAFLLTVMHLNQSTQNILQTNQTDDLKI